DGRDAPALRPTPPGARAGQAGGVVASREDALAHAAGPQARVHVDPGDAPGAPAMRAQHFAHREVAPRGRAAAVEQAVLELVLPARDGGLVGPLAARGDPPGDR